MGCRVDPRAMVAVERALALGPPPARPNTGADRYRTPEPAGRHRRSRGPADAQSDGMGIMEKEERMLSEGTDRGRRSPTFAAIRDRVAPKRGDALSAGASSGGVVFACLLMLCAAAALLVAVLADPSEAVSVLFVVPIGLCGLRWGVRGGLLAACIGFALFAAWDILEPSGLERPDLVSRAVAFIALGGLIGML